MTALELAEIRFAHDTLEALEGQGRFTDADNYFNANSWFFNFDYDGNWIGPVYGEDGWTA